ncbi:HK97 family phage major capsid protein [Rhodococcus sp. PvR044]|uniref:phage major capsid protein n=1 Tax=Rhodococcus sp. PvR044 TaxID=3156402 RepID=UPI003393FCD8
MINKQEQEMHNRIAALKTEAEEMLNRSAGDYLDAEQQTRFDAITTEITGLVKGIENHRELMALVERGSVERSSSFNVPGKDTRPALAGKAILTRDQSMQAWSRDNGHTTDTSSDDGDFGRYLRGVVTGKWDGSEYERSLSEGTGSAGGFLVPTPLSTKVIDLARNQAVVFRAGAITVPMQSQTLKMPRLIGESAPSWRNEGAALTANDLSFDTVTFTAKSLDRLVIMSNELFQDSDPSAAGVISNSFARQIAVELDRAALRGSGTSPEPRGVLNTSGITSTSHGANGTAIANYDWFLNAVGAVRGFNWEPNSHIVAPRIVNELAVLKDSQLRYLEPPASQLPSLVSSQVPINLTVGTSGNTSEIYTGQWDQLAIGIRSGFTIRFLSERYADTGSVAFIANLRADVQVLQPKAFAVDLGVI